MYCNLSGFQKSIVLTIDPLLDQWNNGKKLIKSSYKNILLLFMFSDKWIEKPDRQSKRLASLGIMGPNLKFI